MRHAVKALKNYERFHKRKTEKKTAIRFTMPKALTYLGSGFAIEYKSDKVLAGKKRATRTYRHVFGPGVKIYLHPDQKWILVGGGRFKVTDWMRG